MKKILYWFIPLIFCIGLFFLFTVKEDSKVVSESQLKKAKTILFYRKDCSECKELLTKKRRELNQKDIVLVDLTKEENKKYQEAYGLVSVPTLISGTEEYIGIQYITQYLEGK